MYGKLGDVKEMPGLRVNVSKDLTLGRFPALGPSPAPAHLVGLVSKVVSGSENHSVLWFSKQVVLGPE